MTVKKLVKLIKNDEGSGLVLALMTLMVFSILGVALGTITIGSFKLGDVNRDDNSAYYIAEAGANMAYDELQIKVNDTYDKQDTKDGFNSINDNYVLDNFKPKIYSEFVSQFGENPEASVTIEIIDNENSKDYQITSIGKIGQRTRTVEKNVKVTWISKGNTGPGYGALPSSTTIAKDTMTVGNNAEFLGGTVYLHSSTGTLDFKNNFDNENSGKLTISIPKDSDESKFNINKNVILEERDYEFDWTVYEKELNKFPEFPSAPNYKTLSSTTGNDNTISETSNTITIDTKGEIISILLDDLILDKNLQIVGDGRVDIYVNNSLEIKGNVKVNNNTAETNQLQIFHDASEGEVINFGNNSFFNGTLFSNLADLNIGTGVELAGLFITGGNNVIMKSGNFNSLLIAPNAIVTLATGNSSNAITGITVGKQINIPENANLKFSDYYLKEYPLQVPDVENDGGGTGGGTGEEDTGSGSGNGTSEGELIITEPGIEN